MLRRVILLLFIFLNASLYAQLDSQSLWKVWNDADQPEITRLKAVDRIFQQDFIHDADSALSLAQQQYELAKAVNDEYWKARALWQIGKNQEKIADYQNALASHTSSLEIGNKIANNELIGEALNGLGIIHHQQNELQNAMVHYGQSLKIWEEIGDSLKLATVLGNLGAVFTDVGNFERAISCFSRCLDIAESLDDDDARASALSGIGQTFFYKGENEKALDYFEQSILLYESTKDKEGEVLALEYIGLIYVYQGNYPLSLKYLNRGLSICEEIGADRIQGRILNTIAGIYHSQGNYTQAMEHAQRALTSHQAIKDNEGIVDALLNIGNIYNAQQDHVQALSYSELGLKVARKTGYKDLISRALTYIGSVNNSIGRHRQAMEYYIQALQIHEELGHHRGIAESLYKIGEVLVIIGEFEQAVPYLNRAFAISKERGIAQFQESISNNLYTCYKNLGKTDEALEMYELYIRMRDSLNNEESQKATLRSEFEKRALTDSLSFVQQKADTKLAYQRQISQRNYLIFGGLSLGLLGFLFFRYRQQLRNREKEMELQSERERKEQLVELNALKSRFFANISHELRTPLTLILGPLSYLLDQPDAWEKDSIKSQLTVMQRNGKSLMHLIEEILDLAKLESNKLELEEDKTELKSFVEHVFSAFEPQSQNQNIDLTLQISAQQDLEILIDRNKTEKVLNNFLSNALKFTPEGGMIRLEVLEMPDAIQFKVSDTGKGIHPEDLPHVFDRFYQSQHLEQSAQGGTGIGLGFVREIAHLLNGKSYVESKLGEGSSFYFEIPKKVPIETKISVESVDIIHEVEPIHSIGRDFTIMVVEDNPDMQAFIHQLLEPKYKQVLLANNGIEGLKLLEEHGQNIHLIVSDVMMPEMDGMSMLKEIKSTAEWKQIPVIMLTALAAERNKLNALTIGVDDYLTKPFSVPELLTRVQNLLYNYHQRREWIESEDFQIDSPSETSPVISPLDKEWIDGLVSEIENSLPENALNVDGLADVVHICPRQLSRRIKTITGLSTGKFIKEVQLQMARRELEDGKVISLSDVAYNCGFEHQATFSKVFKIRFGKSPRDYLKSSLRNEI